ncbi:MAG: CDP-alcohol phosphatidyltransferase family protein, partial [Desulfurococcaceae archaeon]
MLTKLRNKVSIAVEPLVKYIAKLGLTPNSLTIASLLIMVAGFSTLIITGDKLLFLPALIASSILDALDGSLARYTGKVTKFGGVLDSTVDRVNDFLSIA